MKIDISKIVTIKKVEEPDFNNEVYRIMLDFKHIDEFDEFVRGVCSDSAQESFESVSKNKSLEKFLNRMKQNKKNAGNKPPLVWIRKDDLTLLDSMISPDLTREWISEMKKSVDEFLEK